MSCQFLNSCDRCLAIPQQEIYLKDLILYTELPELWHYFIDIISLSPLDSHGFLTLSMAEQYMDGKVLRVTQAEFWNCMSVFLQRKNSKIAKQREIKKRQAKRRR